jgi:hypothetical protein
MLRNLDEDDSSKRDPRFTARQELRIAKRYARLRYQEQIHQILLAEISECRKSIEARINAVEESRLAIEAFEKVLLQQDATPARSDADVEERAQVHKRRAKKGRR